MIDDLDFAFSKPSRAKKGPTFDYEAYRREQERLDRIAERKERRGKAAG